MLSGDRRGVGAPGVSDRMSAKTLTSFPTPRQARQLHALPQFKMSAGDDAGDAAVHTTRPPDPSSATQADIDRARRYGVAARAVDRLCDGSLCARTGWACAHVPAACGLVRATSQQPGG